MSEKFAKLVALVLFFSAQYNKIVASSKKVSKSVNRFVSPKPEMLTYLFKIKNVCIPLCNLFA